MEFRRIVGFDDIMSVTFFFNSFDSSVKFCVGPSAIRTPDSLSVVRHTFFTGNHASGAFFETQWFSPVSFNISSQSLLRFSSSFVVSSEANLFSSFIDVSSSSPDLSGDLSTEMSSVDLSEIFLSVKTSELRHSIYTIYHHRHLHLDFLTSWYVMLKQWSDPSLHWLPTSGSLGSG